MRPGRHPPDPEGDQGLPGEAGVREAIPGGGAGEGDRPRRRGASEVLEGEEGAGGGGAEEEDEGSRDRDPGENRETSEILSCGTPQDMDSPRSDNFLRQRILTVTKCRRF